METDLTKFVGKKFIGVLSLNQEEVDEMYWHCHPEQTVVLVFEGGMGLLIMADPEGNGPGWVAPCDISETVASASSSV